MGKRLGLNSILISLFITASCTHKIIQNNQIDSSQSLPQNSTEQMQNNTVVLVSFDGFRADYIKKFKPPHLQKIISEGVTSAGLIPIYPSLTFPNHFSLITGLTAEHHGLIGNHFYNLKNKTEYRVGGKSVTDGSWYSGNPIWQEVHNNGMVTASYFWVGSEADINGYKPDYYFKYNEATPNTERVEQVIKWLKMPAAVRPHFVTLYFSDVDSAGHQSGPDSETTRAAVLKIDQEIARLYQEIKSVSFPIDLIIVSDHGMENVNPQKKGRALDDFFNPQDFKVFVNGGTQVYFYALNKDAIQNTYLKMKKAEKNFRVFLKKDIPKSYHFKNNDNCPDILVTADLGYTLGLKEKLANAKPGGAHGYDPIHKEMWGLFIANGTHFQKNKILPSFKNLNVAPLIFDLLKIKTKTSLDGDSKIFNSVLLQESM